MEAWRSNGWVQRGIQPVVAVSVQSQPATAIDLGHEHQLARERCTGAGGRKLSGLRHEDKGIRHLRFGVL